MSLVLRILLRIFKFYLQNKHTCFHSIQSFRLGPDRASLTDVGSCSLLFAAILFSWARFIHSSSIWVFDLVSSRSTTMYREYYMNALGVGTPMCSNTSCFCSCVRMKKKKVKRGHGKRGKGKGTYTKRICPRCGRYMDKEVNHGEGKCEPKPAEQ